MSLSIPSALRAGDTLTATWSSADYPATAGWVLRLTLINAANKYQVNAAASGADHLLTVLASATANWVPAAYTWSIDATLSAVRNTLATGQTKVLPNLATATTYDTRSNFRKALEDAEAALATYGSKAYLQGIEIGDRKQTFTSPGDFLAYISKLRAQVAREDAADLLSQGLAPKNKLLVRFRR